MVKVEESAPFSQPRRARESEAVAVLDVLRDCRLEIPLVGDLDDPHFLEWTANHCRAGEFWVIECERAIVAVMLVEGHDLSYIAVRSEARSHGLGPRLLAHAQSQSKLLRAKTDEQNTRARRMLERAGFKHDLRSPKESSKVPGHFWLNYTWTV